MATRTLNSGIAGVSPYVIALRDLLQNETPKPLHAFEIDGRSVDLIVGADSFWAIIRRPKRGGLALRAAYLPTPFATRRAAPEEGEICRFILTSALGEHVVAFGTAADALHRLRMTVRFTPAAPMLIPFLPRDLYPLDAEDDPLGAMGTVEAAQRGLNSGLLYGRFDEPAFGKFLYFQNLTAMNRYYAATRTKPDGAVGGEWPELGYLPPTPPQSGTPPTDPLPAGEQVALSDAILVFRDGAGDGEQETAREFLAMLGAAYKTLDLPATEYRDWVERARRTLKDLETAPEATVRHYGNLYVRPYTAAEYPDIMVQMSLIAAIHDWGRWQGEPHPLEARLTKGLGRFYDPGLATLRRYLPNVGSDKDADAVDSWYLYHPMLNLGRMATGGDHAARALFLKSLDFGIKAAHHFDYKWPIQYKVTDFSVITAAANDGRGQTDVGGIYAYVMLLAYELTDDDRFLREARAALDGAKGMKFNVNYQANLTAWGAAACMRLWRISNDAAYLAQSYVYLASFFHNSEIWESRIEAAAHYKNFLGVTCLQDAPYMAIYECFDSYAAFECYLDDSGPDLEPAARMLVSEYCKYALDRAWFYYPDALPREILATENRNGHIDRKLSFPLEDLYPDGQQAGQVGQEIYGAGAAFIFATRAYHHVDDAPFQLFCNHFIRASERTGEKVLSIQLDGGETCWADLAFIRLKRRKLPKVTVQTVGGDVLRPYLSSPDRIACHVPASGRIIVTWS